VELPGTCHALGAVSGIKPNRCLLPFVVRHYSWRRRCYRNFSVQGLDDMSRRNVPGTPKHDMECLAVLVVTGLRVGDTIDHL
jgi:hypothetical protein